jgi:hydroxymethylpyrimidine/phosphomethylpyrimidine kinase
MKGAPPTPRCLTVAGSDSGGGAGIQADLKTFAALGCYGASVITALTAQNTRGVTEVHGPPPSFVAAQIDAVLSDIGADAVKTGMLFSAEIVAVVAERLAAHGVARLVVDPVMVAASGARLLADDAVEAVRARLLPLALVATPNLPEAEALVGGPVGTEEERLEAARRVQALGPRWVVLKGGHGEGPESVDLLVGPGGEVHRLTARRIDTRHTHGTGCSFASALCAGLACGLEVPEAAAAAKTWLTEAIRRAYPIGAGFGPVHHFHAWW